uniref:Uncharacterized protein n=1 Tax=Dunaliella tertiolecta TaxID=3047 RepID=A0A7S3VPF5_DUNTE
MFGYGRCWLFENLHALVSLLHFLACICCMLLNSAARPGMLHLGAPIIASIIAVCMHTILACCSVWRALCVIQRTSSIPPLHLSFMVSHSFIPDKTLQSSTSVQ